MVMFDAFAFDSTQCATDSLYPFVFSLELRAMIYERLFAFRFDLSATGYEPRTISYPLLSIGYFRNNY